jgi:endo-1,4-beta-xylanase
MWFFIRIKNWDINNEIIPEYWYEKATNNPQFTQAMFQKAHSLDPEAKLFLNEYNVLGSNSRFSSVQYYAVNS